METINIIASIILDSLVGIVVAGALAMAIARNLGLRQGNEESFFDSLLSAIFVVYDQPLNTQRKVRNFGMLVGGTVSGLLGWISAIYLPTLAHVPPIILGVWLVFLAIGAINKGMLTLVERLSTMKVTFSAEQTPSDPTTE